MNAIDLFAGAGGFSTGATMAGCTVVWAANHWPAAVQVHANNHPGAVHMLGNAVCPPVARDVINAIREAA
ncbi:MAG TPA: DNA cytosine methyltransferase [Giesbergeria sp.]|nr:DNA cytosine methyltransferase [Giesbergeria sp.]